MDEMKKEGLETAPETTEAAETAAEVNEIAELPAEAADIAPEAAETAAETPADEAEDNADEAEGEDAEDADDAAAVPGRVRKYHYHMSQNDYYNALCAVEVANGKHRLYRNVAMALLIAALVAAVDMSLSHNILAALAAGTLALMGINIRNTDKRSAKKGARMVPQRGIDFSLDLKKHGLSVSDGGNKAMLMPYSIFKNAYETEEFLSLVTVKNTSLNIKRNDENASYQAIRARFAQELGEHFHPDKKTAK